MTIPKTAPAQEETKATTSTSTQTRRSSGPSSTSSNASNLSSSAPHLPKRPTRKRNCSSRPRHHDPTSRNSHSRLRQPMCLRTSLRHRVKRILRLRTPLIAGASAAPRRYEQLIMARSPFNRTRDTRRMLSHRLRLDSNIPQSVSARCRLRRA